VSGDDGVEPIIAFSGKGQFDASTADPLWVLARKDIAARITSARSAQSPAAVHRAIEAHANWHQFLGDSVTGTNGSPGQTCAIPVASDIRVAPLLQTGWGQSTFDNYGEAACYNYCNRSQPWGAEVGKIS
jgi:hypothetical protein